MKETITPSAIRGTLDAPASKSYAQRAVAAALLAEGWSKLQNMGLCDDTSAALDVAEKLGATIESDGRTCRIRGGLKAPAGPLYIGESGLSTRLFSPIAALLDRPVTITGRGSILTRPITMIEQPLRDLGARVRSSNGFLPVDVCGPLLGGEVEVDGSAGSQFLTGLLMALPLAAQDNILHVARLNSKPYIEMTLGVTRAFGIDIRHENFRQFFIPGRQSYAPTTYNIEGDWSGASTLLVAGATTRSVSVKGLRADSQQADARIVEALAMAGARVEWEGDEVTVSAAPLRAFSFDATD
ncbi:MAG: 3-phosphoshikimate 1-carboxyvinyltransferase, partial [Rikenellaceae bacterium]|nr:3-phosphoshikimate 1-carboxyvinyltransferase [Rikenellaceae bacterium]